MNEKEELLKKCTEELSRVSETVLQVATGNAQSVTLKLDNGQEIKFKSLKELIESPILQEMLECRNKALKKVDRIKKNEKLKSQFCKDHFEELAEIVCRNHNIDKSKLDPTMVQILFDHNDAFAIADIIERDHPEQYIENLVKDAKAFKCANDKITLKLPDIKINGIETPIDEKYNNAVTYVTLDYDQDMFFDNQEQITNFDKSVMDSVYSLMYSGNQHITAQKIYETLTGNKGGKMTEKWAKAIEISMSKLHSINITCNFSDLMKRHPSLASLSRTEHLLEFAKTEVQTKKGYRVTAYTMFCKPLLFRAAEAQKRIVTFDMKLLQTRKNSVDATELNLYLLKRIKAMDSDKVSYTIKFDTLFKVLRRETEKEQRTTRNTTQELLQHMKEAGFIKGFTFERSGKKIIAIKIDKGQQTKKQIELLGG